MWKRTVYLFMTVTNKDIEFAQKHMQIAAENMNIYEQSIQNGDKPQWVALRLYNANYHASQAMLALFSNYIQVIVEKDSKIKHALSLNTFKHVFIGTKVKGPLEPYIFNEKHYDAYQTSLEFRELSLYDSCNGINPDKVIQVADTTKETLDIAGRVINDVINNLDVETDDIYR